MVRLPLLLLVALAVPLSCSSAPPVRPASGDEARTMPVFVRETPDAVQLRVHLPPGSDPGSVEVRLADRGLTVRAHDAGGQEIQSARLSLAGPAVEAGATADYDGDGWLTITLRRTESR